MPAHLLTINDFQWLMPESLRGLSYKLIKSIALQILGRITRQIEPSPKPVDGVCGLTKEILRK